jgi:hypothetical protein
MPASQASLASRFAELANVGLSNKLQKMVGPRWFKLGRSRRDALKHEVRFSELQTNIRRVPLIDGEAYWTLDVWNARAEEEGANVHFRLYDPPAQLDVFFVSFERAALEDITPWNEVLSSARQLSEQLGGHVIVRSDELLNYAAEREIPYAEHAAYAAFWGEDRSGRNPLYRWLASSGTKPPLEIVACDSWKEVETPDEVRLRAISEKLAMAEKEAEA